MEEKDWLRTGELSKLTGYSPASLNKLVFKNELPEDKIKRLPNRTVLYHQSIIPILKARRQIWLDNQQTGYVQPEDAIPYDGYVLTPDEIVRLEEVQRNNGYRAARWTTKSLTELMAIGGDLHNNY